MSSVGSFRADQGSRFDRGSNLPTPEIASVIYSSRATSPLAQMEMHKLLRQARARNHAESITGLVIYDNGSFFQWLEGPASGLERVMHSINNDKRHTDIKILGVNVATTRVFGDWDLKLATHGAIMDSMDPAAACVTPGLIDMLGQSPAAARSLLAHLSSRPTQLPKLRISNSAETHGRRQTSSAALRTLIEAQIVPQLLTKHIALDAGRASRAVRSRGQELALLLIKSDPGAASDLIEGIQAKGANSIVAESAALFESSARSLGDLWDSDECSGQDVAIGMCRLQSAVRQMRTSLPLSVLALKPLQSVLVSPQPGELHILRAMLDAAVLSQAGWDVCSEYPETDGDLESLVGKTSFDVLDLTLSLAFRRDDWLPRMAATIANVRVASRNPKLIILVGGRAFSDSPDGAVRVGEDGIGASALDAEWVIRDKLARSVSRTLRSSSPD
jgi:hypothetical protein